MINSAIALEAYDSNQTGNSSQHDDMKRNMTEDDWKPYYDHGDISNASSLPTDVRPRNRQPGKAHLENLFDQPELLDVAYNFFSPSDEVVENPDETEEVGDWDNIWALRQGRHAWVSQEIAKGAKKRHCLRILPSEAGNFTTTPSMPTPGAAASKVASLSFPANSPRRKQRRNLRRQPLGTNPSSTTTCTTRKRGAPSQAILYHLPLSTGIPATSYAAAANALPKLRQINGGDQRNFNMPTTLKSPEAETDWPEDSRQRLPADWLHSDFGWLFPSSIPFTKE